MAGVRRRLSAIGRTVSGALGVRPGEGPAGATAEPVGPPEVVASPSVEAEPVLAQTGEATAEERIPVTQTAPPEQLDDRVPDPGLVAAFALALAAACEVGGDAVGEHLGVLVEGPADSGPVLTHSFATTDRAYVGWRWAVTLARAEGSDRVTVDEVVLLPGAGALLAPSWLPWSDRVQSGDLAAGDLLPPAADDPRLVLAHADPESATDAVLADATAYELGLDRVRVLSLEGRLDAAERWWEGDAGPDSPRAKQAPGRCVDCGFLVQLAGGLRQAFGVCANGVAPDDGRVVALSHGCGAHSETVVEAQHAVTAGMAVEDDEFELVTGADLAAPARAAAEAQAPIPIPVEAPAVADPDESRVADEPAPAEQP